jgi:hypothetical protein
MSNGALRGRHRWRLHPASLSLGCRDQPFAGWCDRPQKVPVIAPARPGDTITISDRWF